MKRVATGENLRLEASYFYIGKTWACLTAQGSRETEQISNRKDKQLRGVRLENQSTGRETFPF